MTLSVCFCDALLDFDVETPLLQPLGGTQSALCYLAVELARRGHRVVLLSKRRQARRVLGVECRSLDALSEDLGRDGGFDCFVFTSFFANFAALAARFDPAAIKVLWTGDGADQRSTGVIAQPTVAAFYDRLVCVSNWHRGEMLKRYAFKPEQVSVLRNAVGPRFEALFASAADLRTEKSGPPRLAYTSTPFRGLDLLLDLFPALRRHHGDLVLDVYSGMTVYQHAPERDAYSALYTRARRLEGVRYHGSVPQPQLAAALRQAAILSYPNTFAETSCIAVMEALAAGLTVVTSDLAALPETGLGFVHHVPHRSGKGDTARFATAFLTAVTAALGQRARDPYGVAEAAFDQVQTINRTCTWAIRAAQWEASLLAWRAAKAAAPAIRN